MSALATYTWDAVDFQAFCLDQNAVAGTPLIFNGSIPIEFRNDIDPGFSGLSRSVSVTTNFAMAGNVVITGTLLGVSKSETVAAPDTDTIETVGLFDKITSVVTTGNAAGVNTISVGSGSIGNTRWFTLDGYRPHFSLTVDVNVISDDIDYTFLSTSEDPSKVSMDDIDIVSRRGIIGPNPDNANAFTTRMVAATTSQVAHLTTPALYACIVVNSSSNSGEFKASFLQQGIR